MWACSLFLSFINPSTETRLVTSIFTIYKFGWKKPNNSENDLSLRQTKHIVTRNYNAIQTRIDLKKITLFKFYC